MSVFRFLKEEWRAGNRSLVLQLLAVPTFGAVLAYVGGQLVSHLAGFFIASAALVWEFVGVAIVRGMRSRREPEVHMSPTTPQELLAVALSGPVLCPLFLFAGAYFAFLGWLLLTVAASLSIFGYQTRRRIAAGDYRRIGPASVVRVMSDWVAAPRLVTQISSRSDSRVSWRTARFSEVNRFAFAGTLCLGMGVLAFGNASAGSRVEQGKVVDLWTRDPAGGRAPVEYGVVLITESGQQARIRSKGLFFRTVEVGVYPELAIVTGTFLNDAPARIQAFGDEFTVEGAATDEAGMLTALGVVLLLLSGALATWNGFLGPKLERTPRLKSTGLST